MIWKCDPIWKTETAFIIGGGTSVATQNVNALRGRRVIVVNSSCETAPFADFLFFGDSRWWFENRRKPRVQNFQGKIVTCSAKIKDSNVLHLNRVAPPPGFTNAPNAVACQRTSLQGAMNLAAHFGAAEIVLLGADMGRSSDGRTHHHAAHPWQNKPGNKTWDIQMDQLRLIVDPLKARGIPVINTSSISRIPWWPKMSLDAVLNWRLRRYHSGRWSPRSLADSRKTAA